ncbi:MAG: hypothetical protein IRY97_09090, partial [Thermomicrobiaceae bacterium]|nr:hypothetical protein [Thermomicrobiaceae bacterium]
GDFRGEGQWLLRERDGQTAVTYDWDVDLTRPGLRLAARLPGARGRLERSHDRVMAEGGRRLARLLAEEAGAARQMGG